MPDALNAAYGITAALCILVPTWVAYGNGGRR